MTTLREQIEKVLQEFDHYMTETDWQLMEGGDLVDVDPKAWLRKQISILIAAHLEEVAVKVEDSRGVSFEGDEAVFRAWNGAIERSAALIRKSAGDIRN